MSDTDELVAWVSKQLDADERTALAAREHDSGEWSASREANGYLHDDGPHLDVGDQSPWVKDVNTGVWLCDDPADDCEEERDRWMQQAAHIAAHDPARVLRGIEAKRALVTSLAEADPDAGYITATFTAHDALRLLATEYADRPGYAEAVGR